MMGVVGGRLREFMESEARPWGICGDSLIHMMDTDGATSACKAEGLLCEGD